MIWWENFITYEPVIVEHNKQFFDNNIFTFDIETSSYLKVQDKFYPAFDYRKYKDEEMEYFSSMYIWMFGINEDVYYGRTWYELKQFLKKVDEVNSGITKICYIHNASFEFQFLYPHFKISNIFARTKRKVITFDFEDFNFSFRCSLFLTNSSLENLPSIYNLKRKKQVGSLDYNMIRNQYTTLTEEELRYCEYDCLVLYDVISIFKDQYEFIYNIPKTSTGIVRKEYKESIKGNKDYYRKIRKSYNSNPIIYTFLVRAFQGGYTHANYIYADEVLGSYDGDEDDEIDSYDISSSYPAHMMLFPYPSTEFKKCTVKRVEEFISYFAYLLKVRFKNVRSRYYNNFISYSKCYDMYNPVCDNGRIISADSFTMYITDIDFKLYLDAYDCEYEIEEAYYSLYKYLPIEFVQFILNKYELKTKLKGIAGKEVEYMIQKQRYNSLFGMSVTNTIRSNVVWNNGIWEEVPLTNEEIEKKLRKEFNYAFLSFSYGVWITAYARNTLCRQIMANDEFLIYADTDSLKLKKGYSKEPILKYNAEVKKKIDDVCRRRNLDHNKFSPVDAKGKMHTIGLFEYEGSYDKFITLGAKKYCIEKDGEIEITVSGIPKKNGKKCLKDINEFRKGKIFPYEITGKQSAFYNDDMPEHFITDYQGHQAFIPSGAGITIVGTDYTLGITQEYEYIIMSSERGLYNAKEKTDTL